MNKNTSIPITKEDVRRAILELKKTREKVTNEAIRNVLERGSFSTIHKYRKQILSEGEISQETTVSAKILSIVESLSESMSEEANIELNAKQAEFKEAISKANDEITELKKHVEDLSSLLQEERALNKKHQISISDLEDSIKKMQHKIESQESEIRTYASLISEKDNRINDLDKSAKHAQDTLEHFRKAAKSQREQDQVKHDSEINSKMLELRQAREEASLYLNSNTKLEKSLARATDKLEAESARSRSLESDIKKYESQLAQSRNQFQKSLEESEASREQHQRDKDELHSNISYLKEQVSSLTSQLLTVEKERDSILKSSNENESLRAQLEELGVLVKGLKNHQNNQLDSK